MIEDAARADPIVCQIGYPRDDVKDEPTRPSNRSERRLSRAITAYRFPFGLLATAGLIVAVLPESLFFAAHMIARYGSQFVTDSRDQLIYDLKYDETVVGFPRTVRGIGRVWRWVYDD